MAESVALISAVRIDPVALAEFLREHGLLEVSAHRWVLDGSNGRIWTEQATEALGTILAISDGSIEAKLTGRPVDALVVTVGHGGDSERMAMQFAVAFMKRWSAVLDDDHGYIFGLDELEIKLCRGERLGPIET